MEFCLHIFWRIFFKFKIPSFLFFFLYFFQLFFVCNFFPFFSVANDGIKKPIYELRLSMTTFSRYRGYSWNITLSFLGHFTCLVGAPPAASGTLPARRNAASATTVFKTAAWPSTSTCGRRTVSEDPSRCCSLLGRGLNPGAIEPREKIPGCHLATAYIVHLRTPLRSVFFYFYMKTLI